MRLVGLRLLVGRPLARVLDRQRGGDHDHLVGAAEPVGLEHHPAQPRVDRQLREPAAERRQLRAGRSSSAPSSCSSATPSRTWRRSGGSRNGKSSTSPSPSAAICRITDGEVRAQDLRVGEARALVEVLLGVEPDADAVGDVRPQRPLRWSADACEIGSIGSRWTFSRAL